MKNIYPTSSGFPLYFSKNHGLWLSTSSSFKARNQSYLPRVAMFLIIFCTTTMGYGQKKPNGNGNTNNKDIILHSCVEDIGNGLYLANFGYTNPTNKTITVEPEESYIFLSDRIEDSEFNGIQKINGITSFEPGTHEKVLSVVFADNGHAKWTVAFGSSDVKVRATLDSPICEEDSFIVPLIGPGNGKTEGFVSPELISLGAGTAGDTPSSIIYQIDPEEEKVLIQIVPFSGKTQEVIDDVLKGIFLLDNSDFIVDPDNIVSEGLGAIDVFFPINKILPLAPPNDPMPALVDYFDIIKTAQALYTPFTSGVLEETGRAVTQGDAAQTTDIVRESFRIVSDPNEAGLPVDGAGVNIVVFSNSFDANPPETGQPTNEALDVGIGDLPGTAGNGNPNGYTTPVNVIKEYPYAFGQLSDEGRAMLQITHDIAPGANIWFRTGVLSPRDFELGIQNLIGLENTIGVDDITFPGEPMFGISNIGVEIQEFTANGNYYFTSAGNFYDNAYQAIFQATDDGTNIPDFVTDPDAVAHIFGNGNDIYQRFRVKSGETYMIVLQWAEDFASQDNILGANFDLDFWVVDDQERLLVGNNYYNDNDTEIEEDGKDPIEYITFRATADGEANFMITSANGNPGALPFRYIIYLANEMEVLEYFDGASTIGGHALTPEAWAIGAADFRKAAAPEPQPFSSHAGTLPDMSSSEVVLSSYDGVNTNVLTIGQNEVNGEPVDGDEFKNFFGTSASVVHVAAAFALMKSALPSWYGPENSLDVLQLFKDNATKVVDSEDQLGDGLVNAANTFSQIATQTAVITDFITEEGKDISAEEFELTINGLYFPEDPTVFYGDVELDDVEPYDPENPNQIVVTVPPFIGNEPVTVFTNSTVPLGTDGGKSNPIKLLDDGITAINLIAQDINIEYGQDYDFDYTVIGLPENVVIGVDLPEIGYVTGATPPYPKVFNYDIRPFFDLDSAVDDDQRALWETNLLSYKVNLTTGSFIVTKKDLQIVPLPVTTTYGETITLDLDYIFVTTGITNNEDFKATISAAHTTTFDAVNNLALISGFKALVNDEQVTLKNLLENGGWIATNRTIENGFKALVNQGNLLNLDTSHFDDYSDYLTNGFKALVNDFKALVNSEDLFNGAASFGSIQNGFKALVNDSDLGSTTDENDYSQIFAIAYDGDGDTPISQFYSLNLITGLDAFEDPEEHYSYPGAFLNPIAYNFNITYGSGTITVEKAKLNVTIGDLVVDQWTTIDTSLIPTTIEGYVYDETEADVFPTGIPYSFKNADGEAYTPGASGIFFITIDEPEKNYEIPEELIQFGVLYVNPTDNLRKIRTYLDCVEYHPGSPDGLDYIANYRYENPNDETIYIAVGPENQLTGPAQYSGELPFIFLPGQGTFQIRFDGNTLKWELTSRDSTHKSSTTSNANANSIRCNSGNEIGDSSFEISPNPTSGLLTIVQSYEDVVTLDVFDYYGILYLSIQLDGRNGPIVHEDIIDMSAYPNGMYFFRFSTTKDVQAYIVLKVD